MPRPPSRRESAMKVLGDVEPRVLAVTPLRNRELSMTAYSAVSFDLSLSRPHLHGAPVPEAAKTGQSGQDISGLQASGLGVADADATYEVACLPGLSHLQVSGTADYTMDPGMLPAGMGSRLESSHKWLSEPTILEDTAAFDSRSPAIDEHTIDSTPPGMWLISASVSADPVLAASAPAACILRGVACLFAILWRPSINQSTFPKHATPYFAPSRGYWSLPTYAQMFTFNTQTAV